MESIFSRLRRKNGYSQLFNSCWKVLTQTIYLLFVCYLLFHCLLIALSLFPPSPFSLPHPLTPSSLPVSFPSFVSHCLIISLSPSSFIPPSLSFTFLCLSPPSYFIRPSISPTLSPSLPLSNFLYFFLRFISLFFFLLNKTFLFLFQPFSLLIVF